MLLLFFVISATAQRLANGNSSLLGAWAVEQFNYSCDANPNGDRMVGHRPLDFNTVSFTNWDGQLKVWTTNWAVMSGVYSPNGSFYAAGKVGVNANDTNGRGCALTSRIDGFYDAAEGLWNATLKLDYSSLCWGCLLDEELCPYTKIVPLSSSRFLSPPAPRFRPTLNLEPPYLQELMKEWPVNASRRCGLLNLGLSAIRFSNVNFTRITVTATTTLGKLVLYGRYDVVNNTFSVSSSFSFSLGAVCTALAQVNGRVLFYENSSCAEEHNATLSWVADASMIILGACANCSQLVFPLSSEPLSDCLPPTASPENETNTSEPTSPPSALPPTLIDVSWRGLESVDLADSFIPTVPMWGAILIVILAFLVFVAICACLFCYRGKVPQKPTPGAEQEPLVAPPAPGAEQGQLATAPGAEQEQLVAPPAPGPPGAEQKQHVTVPGAEQKQPVTAPGAEQELVKAR